MCCGAWKNLIAAFLALAIFSVPGFSALAEEGQQRIEQPVKESIDIRQATQKKEEQWREEKEKLLARYEKLQKENKHLREQKDKMSEQVESAKKRVAAKKNQLADIEEISARIRPFLKELVEKLEIQVEQDLPFLPGERQKRIEKIKGVMSDPETATSEKYRKAMEALLVEAEYGFTTGVYQDTISINGQKRLVNIFRLGRLSLFYLTLNRESCGFYNVAEKEWQTLSALHLPEIRAAVDIATKRKTPEILTLPLGRIVPK